jgi:very-short-patch-repair endonuclease
LSAAHLSIAGDMAFAGATAAVIWELPCCEDRGRLHVAVPRTRNVRSNEFVRIQRLSGELEGVRIRSGFPVLPLERVVVGVASELAFTDLVELVQTLLSDRKTTSARLLAETGRGVRASATVRAAVAVAGDGYGSRWERRLAKLLTSGGHRPQAQHRVVSVSGAVAYLDLAFPAVKLAIEIDGYVAHNKPAQFRRDRTRQNTLVAELGWTVLRYTPYDIATRPDAIVAEIQQTVLILSLRHAS